MALPLLPIEERNFIWEKVLKNPPVAPPNARDWPSAAATKKFIDYVRTTWLTKPFNTWCFFGGGRATTEQQRIAINLRHLRRVQYLLHDIRNKSGATLKSKKKAAVVARAEESALWNADLGVLPEAPQVEDEDIGGDSDNNVEDEAIDGDGDNNVEDDLNDDIDAFVTADFNPDDLASELAETLQEIEKSFATVFDEEATEEVIIDLTSEDNGSQKTMEASDDSFMVIPHQAGDEAILQKAVLLQSPTSEELEDILQRLKIDPSLAANSPLLGLASSPVDPSASFIKHDVRPDGNCCWRSTSYLLTGTEEYYWEIRQQVFAELRDNADLISGIKSVEVQQEYAEKCQELAKLTRGPVASDLWGGTTELLGLANLLSLNIVIYNPNGGKPFFTRCSPVGLRYTQSCPSIFLHNHSEHYQAIVGVLQPEM
uniref:OTU domain-containing protein n=1 Tax=Panagrolaimus sp. ES5 TaxID=591445 RepID=A0AC34FKE3_9BILA